MVSFKQALQILETKGKLERVTNKIPLHKIPDIIRKAEKALIFENNGTEYPVASNICTRDNFCTIFNMDWKQIQEKLIAALDNPIKPVTVTENPFEEAELEKFQEEQQKKARKEAGIEKRRATLAAKKAAKK